MGELVNILASIERSVAGAGVQLRLRNDALLVCGASGECALEVVRLYRPSSERVRAAGAPDRLLVLERASVAAAKAAAPFNHLVLPDGGFRLVGPGVSLLREVPDYKPVLAVSGVRLRGAAGTVAETLLLGGSRSWSLGQLARGAQVSASFAHRVVRRLEDDSIVEVHGRGPRTTRFVRDALALAQTWSAEEAAPLVVARGHLYGSTPNNVMRAALDACGEGAVGGVMAANQYAPTLTRLPFPLRFWVPAEFDASRLQDGAWEETEQGANLEIVRAKGDGWRPHRDSQGLPKVSAWRAWMEISAAGGRTGELAEALLGQLQAAFESGAPEQSPWK